jgi:hypothetical protein
VAITLTNACGATKNFVLPNLINKITGSKVLQPKPAVYQPVAIKW